MISVSKESKLKPREVIKRAVEFFGAKGYGLILKEEDKCNAYLEGGGGGVRIGASEGKKGSTVNIEAVEWEIQAKEFLEKIK
jgi:hypothetical protein